MKNKGDIFIEKSTSGTNSFQFVFRGVGKKLINFGKTFAGIVATLDKVVNSMERIEKITKFISKFF